MPVKYTSSTDANILNQCAALVVVILSVTSFSSIKNDARSIRGKGAWCTAQFPIILFSTYSLGVSGLTFSSDKNLITGKSFPVADQFYCA